MLKNRPYLLVAACDMLAMPGRHLVELLYQDLPIVVVANNEDLLAKSVLLIDDEAQKNKLERIKQSLQESITKKRSIGPTEIPYMISDTHSKYCKNDLYINDTNKNFIDGTRKQKRKRK